MAKVCVGFKCDAQLKEDLFNESSQNGMSLSEYVEMIISNRREKPSEIFIHEKDPQVPKLQERIDYYEKDILGSLFNKYQGKELQFKTPSGEMKPRVISQPCDLLEVIISSIK